MTLNSEHAQELARIEAEYARRAQAVPPDYYAPYRPVNLLRRQSQDRALCGLLDRHGLLPLAGKQIVELGCGKGDWFASFQAFGAERSHLHGIDLNETSVQACRGRYPDTDVRQGDACSTPWPAGSFDIVFQSTVFTSILDNAMRQNLAREMVRLMRRGGCVVSYDFAFNNPANPNVRKLTLRDLRQLFPGFHVDPARVTLAPPLARAIAPRSWGAATLLESLRVFNTHVFALLWR
ncbi:MAG TPA: class I SAM-dependent methyltransferase [Polyangiaceae bacterium]|nr:class I SAM-dependent methyltransferase [Polyangiaceae bacterium]